MARKDTSSDGRSRVVAVLGPTNTGKTHLAMERMLGHASGMIGFPLRLLARENYDRAVRIKGEKRVALITGEEKIVSREASWFLCTVESMPIDRRVAFLGIDEIQMCADPDRGHLFTDRLLHARGELETMVMGAETIRPLLRRLVPDAEFVTRPRFSSLTNAGQCKLSRLPPRTAVVAFSAADVYTIAELVRRQRGGAALVLGALSPRTRNAQVAMYQAGEVDYLVATDAIGMGLNMLVDHVAFAATRKFDGRGPRALTAAEMAQIAGRAGRYTKDGSFGTTAELGPLDPELAERIESHQFEPLTALEWRNSDLQFFSLAALKASLARLPNRAGLVRAREADDELALAHLAQDEQIAHLARGPEAVRLLWDVCCIPDFGKVTGEGHARLLAQMFRFLMGSGGCRRQGRLPTDWVARQVDGINRTDGDIETLMQRIANVRTWTYVAHRSGWLDDAEGWQQRTRAIEDKLSDALHQRLIQRFVDRRTASLVGRMRGSRDLTAAVNSAGEVHVEGHFVGMLEGFRFAPDPAVTRGLGPRDAGRSVRAASIRALGEQIRRRLDEFEADGDECFALDRDGNIRWRGALVARLRAGKEVLAPRLEPQTSDLLEAEAKLRIVAKLTRWLRRYLRRVLAPLFAARETHLSGPARGLLYQTAEALGCLPYRRAATQIAALGREDRKSLVQSGVRLGRESVYYPGLLKP
jgi:ATP-dependent RNA helicase SUPV3L1/SUV3